MIFFFISLFFLIRRLLGRKMVRKFLFQGFFGLSKVQIAEFLWGKTTYGLWTIRGPVGGQVQSVFVVSSSWQCGYWFNYLKVMPVFIRQCGSLQAKKGKETQFPLCALTRTYHSTSTVVILFFFRPSTSQCIRIPVAPSHADISHSLRRGLGSACSLPFCGAQLLCLPGASTGVKPL